VAAGNRSPGGLGAGYGHTVPDAIFAHPRLAPVYDAFDGPRDDLPAYVGIADELGAHRVLDAGCGTGSLAILLARTGRDVIGADPAAASLEVAKSKDTDAAVSWVHTDAAALPTAGADLAVMTGNVAQVFLTDADWAQALRGVGAALRPRGYLVFETRRPATPRCGSAPAGNWNRAWPPRATRCSRCAKPRTAPATNSCSSPSAPSEPAPAQRRAKRTVARSPNTTKIPAAQASDSPT
jgi:SAM-dependent methyltransferase